LRRGGRWLRVEGWRVEGLEWTSSGGRRFWQPPGARWRVEGSGFRVQGQELSHHDSGFRSGSGFRVSGFGCRVHLRIVVPSAVHLTRPSAGKGLLLEPELLARDRVLREVVGAPLLPRERNRDGLLFTQRTRSALPETKSVGSEKPFSCGTPGTNSGARTSCD